MIDLPRAYARLCREIEALDRAKRPFEAARRLEAALRDLPPSREAYEIRGSLKHRRAALKRVAGRAWFPFTSSAARHRGGLLCVDVRHGEVNERHFNRLPGSQAAIEIVKALLGRQDAALHAVVHHIEPAELEQLRGASAQLAVAVATWSLLNGQPLPLGVVFTGMVEADGALITPSGLAEKLDVVEAEHLGLGVLYTGDGPTARGVRALRRLQDIIEALGFAFSDGLTFEACLRRVNERIERSDWQLAASLAARGVALGEGDIDEDQLYFLTMRRAEALNHQGQSAAAAACYEGARRWAEEANQADVQRFAAVYGVTLIDQGRAEEAMTHLRARLDAFPQSGLRGVEARFCLAQLQGTQARACSACGLHDEAIEAGREALRLTRRDERARNLQDLAFWCLRAGRLDEAQAYIDQAHGALEGMARCNQGAARWTSRFLELTQARVWLERHEAPRALALLRAIDHQDHPALLAGIAAPLAARGEDVSAYLTRIDPERSWVQAMLCARVALSQPAPDLAWVKAIAPSLPLHDLARARAELELRVPY
ncbi:hypothetical protein KKF91_12190 [Myxococcota bacterium]|nr:hypothetical protein [Myxococcota bacterium]MBU1431291.1 hypothetical protein [Myxococcota bacterium]